MERPDSFPKLYGAPGTFRPPKTIADSERPPNPDDLPLEFDHSEQPHDQDGVLRPRPFRVGSRPARRVAVEDDEGQLTPTHVGLRGLAERLLRERSARPIPAFRKRSSRGVGSPPSGE